jgi:hypothetical protein
MSTARSFAQLRDSYRMIDGEHPVWEGRFDESLRTTQMEDDLFAARSVCGVLIAIVTGGALLGALAVAIATLL